MYVEVLVNYTTGKIVHDIYVTYEEFVKLLKCINRRN